MMQIDDAKMIDVTREHAGTVSRDEAMRDAVLTGRRGTGRRGTGDVTAIAVGPTRGVVPTRHAVKGAARANNHRAEATRAAMVDRRRAKGLDSLENADEAMRDAVPMARHRHRVRSEAVTEDGVMLARHVTAAHVMLAHVMPDHVMPDNGQAEATRAVMVGHRLAKGVDFQVNAAEAMRGEVPMARHRTAGKGTQVTEDVVMPARNVTLTETTFDVMVDRRHATGVVNVDVAIRGVVPMARHRNAATGAAVTEDVVMLGHVQLAHVTLDHRQAEATRAATMDRRRTKGVDPQENAAVATHDVVPMARHEAQGAREMAGGAKGMAKGATASEDDAIRVGHLLRRLAMVATPSAVATMSFRIGSLGRQGR